MSFTRFLRPLFAGALLAAAMAASASATTGW
jgi:hypothetical protein